MLKALLFVLTVIVIPVLLILLVEWSPRITQRLLKWAAGQIGAPAVSARYLEEWQGDIRDFPQGLSQLLYALSRIACLPWMVASQPARTSNEAQGDEPWLRRLVDLAILLFGREKRTLTIRTTSGVSFKFIYPAGSLAAKIHAEQIQWIKESNHTVEDSHEAG